MSLLHSACRDPGSRDARSELPMSAAECEIQELISRAQSGEELAMHQLLSRYRAFLQLQVQSRLGPLLRQRVDAADIVQQTELDAAQKIQGFRGTTEQELSCWLQTILRNNLLDIERYHFAQERDPRRERHDNANADGESSTTSISWFCPTGRDASPSCYAINGESALRLAAAVEALPAGERDVVRMRHIEGLKLHEIAAAMNKSTGAIAGMLRRGVMRLRKEMGSESRWFA